MFIISQNLQIDAHGRLTITAGNDNFHTLPVLRPHLENLAKLQMNAMFATGVTVDLAERIINDTVNLLSL